MTHDEAESAWLWEPQGTRGPADGREATMVNKLLPRVGEWSGGAAERRGALSGGAPLEPIWPTDFHKPPITGLHRGFLDPKKLF